MLPDVRANPGFPPPANPVDFVECVPNVSEGQRQEVITELANTIAGVPEVRLLDVHSDPRHNRSVFTFVGPGRPVAAAVQALAAVAVARIDMRLHRGVHPRIGAVDVVPFVPLASTSMAWCVELAHQTGERLAAELGLPVYFYGEAALRPERRRLANIRRGEYEGLAALVGTDPTRAPDAGPAKLGPAGACAVGAREPLVAFNMLLHTNDLAIGRSIARAVRESSGGLPGVQALAFPTGEPSTVQLSMNLTRLRVTPVHAAVQKVREEAAQRGVRVGPSELVGLLPISTLLDAAAATLGLPRLSVDRLLPDLP